VDEAQAKLTLVGLFRCSSRYAPTQGATLTLDTIDLVRAQHQRRAVNGRRTAAAEDEERPAPADAHGIVQAQAVQTVGVGGGDLMSCERSEAISFVRRAADATSLLNTDTHPGAATALTRTALEHHDLRRQLAHLMAWWL